MPDVTRIMETNMKIRVHTVVLAAAMALSSLSPAAALRGETRPPPNGMNGVSVNGQSIGEHTVSAATLKSVVLKDGSRIELR
jgi:hypothetical protein